MEEGQPLSHVRFIPRPLCPPPLNSSQSLPIFPNFSFKKNMFRTLTSITKDSAFLLSLIICVYMYTYVVLPSLDGQSNLIQLLHAQNYSIVSIWYLQYILHVLTMVSFWRMAAKIISVLFTVAGIQVDFRGIRIFFEFSCIYPREFEKYSFFFETH